MSLEDVLGLGEMSEATSKALIKLLEVLQIGIGGTFAPAMGYIKRIAEAKGEVHSDRILRRGKIKTEKLLLRDQNELDELRRSLDPAPALPSGETVDAEWIEVDLSELTSNASLVQRAKNRFEYQEAKRQFNVERLAALTIDALQTDGPVADEPVDLDWIARFFDAVKDVSQAEMQKYWARILAGEIAQPGRFSLRTLDVLRSLRQFEALLLERVAPFAFDGGDIVDEKEMFVRVSGLTFNDILRLEECGLMQRDMSWFVGNNKPDKFLSGFGFLNKWITLTGADPNFVWKLHSLRLTSAGLELRNVGHHRANDAFLEELRLEALRRGLTLTAAER